MELPNCEAANILVKTSRRSLIQRLLVPQLLWGYFRWQRHMLRTEKQTPCSRFLRDKRTVTRQVKNVPASYGTGRFSAVFTGACSWHLSWATWILSSAPCPVPLKSLALGVKSRSMSQDPVCHFVTCCVLQRGFLILRPYFKLEMTVPYWQCPLPATWGRAIPWWQENHLKFLRNK